MKAPTHPRAAEIWFEGDNGWWADLLPGYQFDGCHTVHADETLSKSEGLKDLKWRLDNLVYPCFCSDCEQELAEIESGCWISLRHINKKWTTPVFVSIGLTRLLHYRAVIKEATEEWLRKNRAESGSRFGFVPRTFADAALRSKGIRLPIKADEDLCLTYAVYQEIKVFQGDWETGPIGRGHILPAVYGKDILTMAPDWEL